MNLSIKLKPLIISIIIPLAVGGVSALLTMNGMQDFKNIKQPPLSPPGWLFPVVWSILYILMGIASYIVYTKRKTDNRTESALKFYVAQLVFNFFWSIIFFNLDAYLFAFIWLVILWALILLTTIKFYQVSKPAGYLMVLYLLWVTFAGYLNLAIYILNR
ncbi:MAG: tryptophan-rich sensory protein [Clostridia bacterium]|nr:tryptophan-rich sensory protein [Clostridia bacterium]